MTRRPPRPHSRIARLAGIAATLLALLLAWCCGQGAALPTAAQSGEPPYTYGRFGFGLAGTAQNAYSNGLGLYLNAGWYWDWAARGVSQIPPLEYVQTVRFKPVISGGVQVGYTPSITGSALRKIAQANPGALWFIGNEPDCTNLDNLHSTIYARAYHDLYMQIKQADPTARIGAGNIVQPTPLRFAYLERVLETYEDTYHAPLPADFWSTHSYILCENCWPLKPPGEPFAWGACYVPDWPTQRAPQATFYHVYDHWNVTIFASRIISFRQWLYDHGYRQQPLVIPEYGTLMWPGLITNTQQDDIVFMNATFDWMRNARDERLGYALDDGRLVQRWAWYSLDHGNYPGGSLFINNRPSYLGQAYRAYTLALTPTTRLRMAALPARQTATLQVGLANAGDTPYTVPFTLSLFSPNAPEVPAQTVIRPALGCCGDHRTLTLPIPRVTTTTYTACLALVGSTAALPITPGCVTATVDLHIENRTALTGWLEIGSQTTLTPALTVRVSNRGDLDTGEPVSVTLVEAISGQTIARQAIAPIHGQSLANVTASWPGLNVGDHTFRVIASTPYVVVTSPVYTLTLKPRFTRYLPLSIRKAQ